MHGNNANNQQLNNVLLKTSSHIKKYNQWEKTSPILAFGHKERLKKNDTISYFKIEIQIYCLNLVDLKISFY